MKIGIVGYSAGKFDYDLAKAYLQLGIKYAELTEGKALDGSFEIVSGLTNIGIPALAYEFAAREGVPTAGIACSKAEEYDCYKVDNKIIVGDEWGAESDTFLKYIDCLVRVGGGKQSYAEVAAFRELKPGAPVIEMELPREG